MGPKTIAAIAGALVLLTAAGEGLYIKHLWGVVAEKNAALRKASGELKAASVAIKDRDAELDRRADHERQDANQLASFWKGQTNAAFSAGLAAHRCPGDPAGVQPDLRALWSSGAFKTAPDVPGKPQR